MVLATENGAAMATPQRKAPAPPAASSPILQADELSLNPRWSPHLKSPRPSSTIASRLKQQSILHAGGDGAQPLDGPAVAAVRADVAGALSSPLNKRARMLQTGSPESLPPLSPVVSSRRRTLRSDLAQEAAHPFSPTSSALRIRYPPSSPLSPTLRSTPCRGEPESPTLLRRLVKESPSLSLDEKLGSGIGASGRHGLEDE
ncbi:hypothetical protein H4R21_006814, partial [Coemansia helicoidea]